MKTMKTRSDAKMHRSRVWLLLLGTCAAVALLPMTAPAAQDNGVAPRQGVKETTDKVIDILARHDLSAAQKRKEIEDVVYDHFDFETLSRLVLARNWRQLKPEQQKQFVQEFKQHLSITYGRNVENYHNEKVVITGDRKEARDDWTVQTRIARPGADDIRVDYRLRQETATWRVIDVIVEGVSLVANFRSQFQQIISDGGTAKLIELLHDKNVKGEPLKGAPGT